jgi:hypothetical protein
MKITIYGWSTRLAGRAGHSWSLTLISANPSRLVPRQRDGLVASGCAAVIPMPQIRSRGLASTSTLGRVAARNAPSSGRDAPEVAGF